MVSKISNMTSKDVGCQVIVCSACIDCVL